MSVGETMANDGCGDRNAVGGMAVELFQLASLLVGDNERALPLIENALATMEIDPCLDPEPAREQARRSVVREALAQLAADEPAAFASQAAVSGGPEPCVHDEDLQAAGVTADDLRHWLEQRGEGELDRPARVWLERLPLVQRAVFVQRAVLGQGNEAAARLLREAGGEQARGWTPEKVSELFRRALCSLADSLAHAPGLAPVPA